MLAAAAGAVMSGQLSAELTLQIVLDNINLAF